MCVSTRSKEEQSESEEIIWTINKLKLKVWKDHCETHGVGLYCWLRRSVGWLGSQNYGLTWSCVQFTCIFMLIFSMMLEFFVLLEPKSTCATTL